MAPSKPKDSKAGARSGRSSGELGPKVLGETQGGRMSRNGSPTPAPRHMLDTQSHPLHPTAATSPGTLEGDACTMALQEGAGLTVGPRGM